MADKDCEANTGDAKSIEALVGVRTLQSFGNRLTTFGQAIAGMVLLSVCGCAGRAYSDLYIENMAGEIRDLEDQLYEYDYQYRALEQENADLRHQNQILQARQSQTNGLDAPSEPSRREPPDSGPREAEGIIRPNPPMEEDLGNPESILERQPSGTSIDSRLGNGPGSQFGDGSQLSPGMDNPFPSSQGNLPTPPGQSPPNSMRENSNPAQGPTANESFDLDPNLLEPPSIELGDPIPPSVPTSGFGEWGDNSASNGLNKTLSRIKVPARLAGQRTPEASPDQSNALEPPDNATPRQDLSTLGRSDAQSGSANMGLATIKPALELKDRRIVEITFHPSLSRSANFDDRSDDDGLYLVLQPMNQRGEVVPLEADLSIAVVDPAREQSQSVIGRWDYSAAEVRQKIKPIGSDQGIHLTLPWNGPDPIADRVEVFARYTFSDGRQVVGIKTIFVSTESSQRTVWAPRGSSQTRTAAAAMESMPNASPVATASFNEPEPKTQIVRPDAGVTSPEPPPVPRGYAAPLH